MSDVKQSIIIIINILSAKKGQIINVYGTSYQKLTKYKPNMLKVAHVVVLEN